MDILAVTVRNQSSHDVYVDRDPNWDDQVLTFDGVPGEGIYLLAPGSSVVVGITDDDYNQMGVIFAGAKNYEYPPGAWFYQLTIGPDPDTGDQSVTDSYISGSPTVEYRLEDQEPLSMTMVFVDIGGA